MNYWNVLFVALLAISQPSFAASDDILDYLPGIIAGIEKKPPPPPYTPPAGVTLLPTYTLQADYSGDLLVIGEIYNNTSSYMRFVDITANIFNNGNFVATDFTYVNKEIMAPRTKSCFKMYTGYPGAYTQVKFEKPTYSTTSNRPANLSLSNVSRTVDYSGDLKVIGFVTNRSNTTIDFVSVVGTFYKSNGKAIDCDYSYASNSTLTPNQSSSFDIWTSTPSSSVTSFVLQPDG